MSILDTSKDVLKLVNAAANRDLYEAIVKLQAEAFDLSTKNLEMSKEIHELKESLAMRAKMNFDAPFYFVEGDPIPWCAHCWESEKIAMHLKLYDDNSAKCSKCHTGYRSTEPGQAVRMSRGRGPESREPG